MKTRVMRRKAQQPTPVWLRPLHPPFEPVRVRALHADRAVHARAGRD